MKKPVVLRIFKGDQLLGVKQFVDAQVVLGRPGDVQVPLDGERVSLIHAAIEERESGYFICDLGSENGTFKNGEPVLDSPLESGDIIQVGEFRIEFFIGVPKPKAPGTVEITKAQVPATAPTQTATSAPKAVPAATPVAPKIPTASPVQQASALKPAPEKAQAPVAAPKQPAATVKPPPAKAPPASTRAPAAAGISPAQLEPFPTPSVTTGSSLAGPRTTRPSSRPSSSSHSKRAKTFAPPSKYKDVRDFVKPSKGTVVEVLVAWRERIIESRHFTEGQTVTLGSDPGCDIVLPLLSSRVRKVTLVKIDRVAKIFLAPEMSGELIRGQATSSFAELVRQNKMTKDGAQNVISLEQGEMVRVELNDQISVIVRYTSDSPKPLVAPMLDLTASEFTGVILAAVLIAILRLYTFLYTPPVGLPDDTNQDPVRIAIVATPTPVPPIPPPRAEATPAPTPPPPVVKATPQPTKAPEIKQAVAKPKATAVTNLTTKQDPGKSANAAPNKNKTGPRTVTSPKQGGAIKTTPKEGSQMNSAKRDVTKSGVFSAFGSGGAQDKIAQESSGSGALVGLADAATGRSGQAENRAGQGLGSATKDTGMGGTGKAALGINGGIGTSGRGSGNSGYGTGGLGNKAGTKIVTGGAGESFSGTIDREAIRRVLKANERTIRTCYERQLNRNPDLFGKLVLTWDIADGGRALHVHVSSNELGNADVANCIMDRLKTWKFPDPPANQQVEVSYPWFFSN